MPFVQGHLTHEPVTVSITSECAHCSESIHFDVNDELHYEGSDVAQHVVFLPVVDFKKLKDPSIIDAF